MKKIGGLLVVLFFYFNTINGNGFKNTSSVSITLTAQKIEEPKYLITQCDTLSLEHLDIREQDKICVTIKESTKVYCSPDIQSTIIDSLKFNTEFKNETHIVRFLYNEKGDYRGEKFFYEIHLKDKIGYVLKDDLAEAKLNNHIILTRPDYSDYKVLNINEKDEIVDSLSFNGHSNNEIKFTKRKLLSFNKRLIYLRTYRTSCPGASAIDFMTIDQKGKLKKIINSYDHTGGSATVYFPIALKNGSFKYSINAQTECEPTSLPISYQYLESLNIPIKQLIIKAETEYEGDIEGLSEEEIEIANYTVTIFNWEKDLIQKVKTFKSVKVGKNNSTNYPKKGKAYVIAKSGLTYREAPSIKAKKINKLNFGTEVIIVENSGVELTIKDDGKTLKGQWVKVKSQVNASDKKYQFTKEFIHEGYVFNGFLVDALNVK